MRLTCAGDIFPISSASGVVLVGLKHLLCGWHELVLFSTSWCLSRLLSLVSTVSVLYLLNASWCIAYIEAMLNSLKFPSNTLLHIWGEGCDKFVEKYRRSSLP